MRLWGINTEFVGLFPRVSLWGLLFCWDWILIYRNWSILACKSVPAPAQPALTTSRSGVGNYIYPMIHHFEIYYQLWRTTWSSHFKMDANKDTPWQEEQFRIQSLLYFYCVDLSYVFQFTNVFVHLSLPSQQLSRAFQIGLKMYKEALTEKETVPVKLVYEPINRRYENAILVHTECDNTKLEINRLYTWAGLFKNRLTLTRD